MTLRVGIRSGLRVGINVGLNNYGDVARDGPGIAVPASAAEWQSLGIAVPRSWWLAQEASGDLDDAQVAAADFDLVPNAAPTYQNTRSGWSGYWVGYADAIASQRFAINDSVTWDPTLTSLALQGNFEFTTLPAAQRVVMVLGNAGTGASGGPLVRLATDGRLNVVANGVSSAGTYVYVDGAKHPVLCVYDRVGARLKIFTDKEEITGTYTTLIGNLAAKGFGAANSASGPPAMFQRNGAGWLGADAAALDKTLLQKLGWSLPY